MCYVCIICVYNEYVILCYHTIVCHVVLLCIIYANTVNY